MNELKFADNVTMRELNPHNFALKNDYISNLISTALNVIPYANEVIGSDRVRITRGFLSYSYIMQELNIPSRIIKDIIKHSEGMAIELTWKEFDNEEALVLAKTVVTELSLQHIQVKVVINTVKSKVSFYFDVSNSEIGEDTSEGYRIIST